MGGELSATSSSHSITGDEVFIAQRDKPKRKWLSDDSDHRQRRAPRGETRHRGLGGSSHSGAAKCSSETVNLGALAASQVPYQHVKSNFGECQA